MSAPRETQRDDEPVEGCVSLREYLAVPRVRVPPYVATEDGRTVLLAPETTLVVAGPSGVAKSLVASWDLGGRLAAPEPSRWLGFQVCGGLRVGLISFEGSDEDTEDRGRALVPDSARDRLAIWDRWRRGPAPLADDEGIKRLAAEALRLRWDVAVLDPGSAFFAPFDTSKGIPEDAYQAIDHLRALTGRQLAFVIPLHTRKLDTRASTVDELEEIAGTFARRVDAAVVIRREEKSGPRRRVSFPKVRRGPEPEPVIAALPNDPGAPPRLTVVSSAVGRPEREGTEAEKVAAWIADRDAPASVADVCDALGLSDSTLRRRRGELEKLGVRYGPLPGRGTARFYGTEEQWATVLGELGQGTANPSPVNPSRDGLGVLTGPEPHSEAESQPVNQSTRRNAVTGTDSALESGIGQPVNPSPPSGGEDPAVTGPPSLVDLAEAEAERIAEKWGHG